MTVLFVNDSAANWSNFCCWDLQVKVKAMFRAIVSVAFYLISSITMGFSCKSSNATRLHYIHYLHAIIGYGF
jgi:hypothetical protein